MAIYYHKKNYRYKSIENYASKEKASLYRTKINVSSIVQDQYSWSYCGNTEYRSIFQCSSSVDA